IRYELYKDSGTTAVASNTTGADFTGLVPGDYYVKVFGNDGEESDECEASSGTETIIEPKELTVSISSTNVTCYGDDDGVVSIGTTTGDIIRYELYKDSGTTAVQTNTDGSDFTGLTPGDYYVKVFGNDGEESDECEASSGTETIIEPKELTVSISSTNVTCYGDEDGVVKIGTTTGDIIRYELYKDSGTTAVASNTTGADFTGLVPGDYYVKVFGNNG
ncbi:hypothetical protein, partial [Salegentibacter chungangensis]